MAAFGTSRFHLGPPSNPTPVGLQLRPGDDSPQPQFPIVQFEPEPSRLGKLPDSPGQMTRRSARRLGRRLLMSVRQATGVFHAGRRARGPRTRAACWLDGTAALGSTNRRENSDTHCNSSRAMVRVDVARPSSRPGSAPTPSTAAASSPTALVVGTRSTCTRACSVSPSTAAWPPRSKVLKQDDDPTPPTCEFSARRKPHIPEPYPRI
jgi:hypothetical protein